MDATQEDLRIAIQNCDKDPIHIPGAIQDAGFLISADARFETISRVSANVQDLWHRPAETLLGAPTSEILSSEFLHGIRNLLGHPTVTTQRELLRTETINGQEYQLSIHRRGVDVIAEFVPEQRSAAERLALMGRANAFLSLPIDGSDMVPFFQEATDHMRALLEYDRVKFYLFLPDKCGEVIAESRTIEVDSFLGMRYPASDVPPIARQLYAKTPIRVISSVQGADVPVLSLDDGEALDMSLALLRGKDSVHRQYLINMGVGGTATIPVVVNGELWGMFAAHHREAKLPDPSALSAAELIGKLVSLRVQHTLEARREAVNTRATHLANRVVIADDSALASSMYWDETKDEFLRLLRCDGVVFAIGEQLFTHGDVPAPTACAMALAMGDPDGHTVTMIDDLKRRMPGASWGDTAGAMVISVREPPNLRFAFLRNESATQVKWGGQPEKSVRMKDGVLRLEPRNSFELYLENVQNRSDIWSEDDEIIGNALRRAFSAALSIQNELEDNRHRLGLMVRELNHRVRNILALVQSLSSYSREDAESVEVYATNLEQRILALAGAHNLLTDTSMSGAPLLSLVRMELRPYNGAKERIVIDGPDVFLRTEATSLIALLFHELASNAVKYGSLSVPDGHVTVRWEYEEKGLHLTWQESNGPRVNPPTRSGFGMAIIRDAIPYEFGGRTDLQFPPTGLTVDLWLPRALFSGEESGSFAPMPEIDGNTVQFKDAQPRVGGQLSVLVVEDNFVVANQAVRMLDTAGFDRIETSSNLREALALLEDKTYDFCLLDVNLQGLFSVEVARMLKQKKIPFAFATGYGSDGMEMAAAENVPVLKKPMEQAALEQVLSELLNKD